MSRSNSEPQPLDESLLRSGQRGSPAGGRPRSRRFRRRAQVPASDGSAAFAADGKRFGTAEALEVVRLTLDKMAAGGIYDHLGGGFHRYSTDARWLVPHFEKMLYDNALLATAYLEAFQATHEPRYAEVVRETLDYVLREMTDGEGGFYSTQDADSEGEEGKFFVWSEDEVLSVLGAEKSRLFCYCYDVTSQGNWEGEEHPQPGQDARAGGADAGPVGSRNWPKSWRTAAGNSSPCAKNESTPAATTKSSPVGTA